MSKTWYAFEPRSPLVFRSAKPFGAGSRDGANFPWPSSLAGAVRTRAMDGRGWDVGLSAVQQAELRAIEVTGPLLARRRGEALAVYTPRPADAVLLLDVDRSAIRTYHRLRPEPHPAGTGSDLPAGLWPLSFRNRVKGKPQPAPAFWPLADLRAWGEGRGVNWTPADPLPWATEQRTHVGIDRERMAAEGGRLFQTEGIDLGPRRLYADDGSAAYGTDDWLLLAATPERLAPGLITLGGERRLSWLSVASAEELAAPASLSASLSQGFALTLATPGLFSQGWRPGWLDDRLEGEVPGCEGLRVRLRAAAVERWQSVSGWDLATWRPKSARKAVAAGAVYWFECLTGDSGALQRLWLARVSDDEQDRRDGFGLVIPRPWNAAESGEV